MRIARRFLVAFIVVFVSAVCCLVIFVPNTSRIALNQSSAFQRMQDLNLAEHNYAAQHRDAGFACNLGDLGKQGLVDGLLASGTRSGYHFDIQCPQNGSQLATSYMVIAVPVEPGRTGKYAFCTDQSGEIWYGENGLTADCLARHKPLEQKYR